MNPARISYILQVLQQTSDSKPSMEGNEPRLPLKGLKALDVGCGGGVLSESLARLGASITAIDPSSLAEAAKQHSSQTLGPNIAQNIDYRVSMSIEELAAEMQGRPNSDLFDVICILEVIEHTENPYSIFCAASSLLKKPTINDAGGVLFVSSINRTLKSYAIAVVGAEYVTRKVPIGTHNWNQFYSPQDVKSIAKSVGLQQLNVCGMIMVSSSLICGPIQWILDENDTDVNWISAYNLESPSSS